MNAPLSPAQIMKVDRMWMLPPFKEALRRYARERTLLDQLFVCLERIFTEPQSPGLHLESLNNTESPVYSARINQGERLILHAFNSRELGLLNFGQHDQMYRWVDSHRNTLPTMLTKLAEVARGRPLSDVAATVRVVHATEDDPIALEAAEQFRRMLDGGISEYLAALDDDQRVLVNIRPHGLLVVKGGAGTGKTAVAAPGASAGTATGP